MIAVDSTKPFASALVPHSIALWRITLSTPNGPLPLRHGVGLEELPGQGDDLVAEIMRQYPTLSRALAEYLLR
jgi:hypothetical protein